MDRVEALIDGFLSRRWESKPFEAMLAIRNEQPEEMQRLIISVIDRVPDGGTFFDAALSFLSEEDFALAVEHAWKRHDERGRCEVADSIFVYCSLQFPQLLTPYLEQMFENLPNEGYHYQYFPWRAADQAEHRRLRAALAGNESLATRQRAWWCLHSVADLDDVDLLVDSYSVAGHGAPVGGLLLESGIDFEPDPARYLAASAAAHLVFPDGYFTEQLPTHRAHESHPTWCLPEANASSVELGGTIEGRHCGSCDRELSGLIKLNEGALDVSGSDQPVQLATCLTCLGWVTAPMFFAHDNAGLPRATALPGGLSEPEWIAEPLERVTLAIAVTPHRWVKQDWALSNGRENLNRIGGPPSWVQSAEYPNCPQCEMLMPFVAQLDSELPDVTGNEVSWGSGGLCYLFWCAGCRISANTWQCT